MPGPSFCWGPELEGPRSPSSSRSSTRGQAGRDRRGCAARAPPPPPRASHPPHPPHARIPHFSAALHRPRAALHASLAPHSLLPSCAQELNFALLPRPGSRAARRGGAAAAARPVRAGRALWRPRGWRGGVAGGVPRRRQGGRPGSKKGWLQWEIFFVPLVDKS